MRKESYVKRAPKGRGFFERICSLGAAIEYMPTFLPATTSENSSLPSSQADNVYRTYVSQLERGIANPSLLILYRISKVLETELQFAFLDASTEKHPV